MSKLTDLFNNAKSDVNSYQTAHPTAFIRIVFLVGGVVLGVILATWVRGLFA